MEYVSTSASRQQETSKAEQTYHRHSKNEDIIASVQFQIHILQGISHIIIFQSSPWKVLFQLTENPKLVFSVLHFLLQNSGFSSLRMFNFFSVVFPHRLIFVQGMSNQNLLQATVKMNQKSSAIFCVENQTARVPLSK